MCERAQRLWFAHDTCVHTVQQHARTSGHVAAPARAVQNAHHHIRPAAPGPLRCYCWWLQSRCIHRGTAIYPWPRWPQWSSSHLHCPAARRAGPGNFAVVLLAAQNGQVLCPRGHTVLHTKCAGAPRCALALAVLRALNRNTHAYTVRCTSWVWLRAHLFSYPSKLVAMHSPAHLVNVGSSCRLL